MITVIDSDNYAASGIETIVFPGGEPHVKLPIFPVQKHEDFILLYLKARTLLDTFNGALVLDALSRQGQRAKLFCPYFPGARQDRANDGTAPLTIEIMGQLLSHRPTYVFDLHSDLARVAMDWDPSILMPSDLPEGVQGQWDGVIAPDKGALNRAMDFLQKFCPGTYIFRCEKDRDPKTGRILSYQMPPLPKSGHYIVVDDICDGGATFNLLAECWGTDWLASGSTLDLFVSHGIFSRGIGNISPIYHNIITTDSWCQANTFGRLRVIPLLPQLLPLFGT